MRRKRIIKMSAYKVTPKIIASYVFGLVSFGVLILLCIFSAMSKGQAGFAAGIIPIIMMIFNIVGLVISYPEIRNDDIKPKHVFWSSSINGIMVILYLVIYICGIIMG